jgi:hypothetical protein
MLPWASPLEGLFRRHRAGASLDPRRAEALARHTEVSVPTSRRCHSNAGPKPAPPANRRRFEVPPTNHFPCSSADGKPPATQQTRPTPAPGGVPFPGESRQMPRPVVFRCRLRMVIVPPIHGSPCPDPEADAGATSTAAVKSIRGFLRCLRWLPRPFDPEAVGMPAWPKPAGGTCPRPLSAANRGVEAREW